MRYVVLVLTLAFSIPITVSAAPTALICTTDAENEEVETVNIRFDDEEETFELRGRSLWSVGVDDDGAAKVKDAEFTESTITVKFKRRAAIWLSLGAAAASGGRVGVLDRTAGTWSLGSRVFQCEVASAVDRRF